MIDFYILGNPRSGTTLLRLMMSAHSGLIVPPEAGFAVFLLENWDNKIPYSHCRYISSLKRTTKIVNWGIDYQELDGQLLKANVSSLIEAMQETYRYYAVKHKEANCLIGDKNNFYIHHISSICKLSPKAKFIHIIRDGRDVACSYQEVMSKGITSKYAPNLPTDIKAIATEWADNNQKLIDELSGKNVYQIKLEDLIARPKDVLVRICTFLGVNYDKNMLDYYEKKYSDMLEPEEYNQWKLKNRKPLINDSYKYKKILTKEDVKLFEKLAGKQLSYFEYPIESSEIEKIGF
ncbi:hypothetical protein CW745_10390 [Psychromonas sp. psych-6C06]|uniref:sulfotransferase family protein n=1 Tax=Psychromonas sp. psych-6C06 TaxID=2058089 RepID=UPI000C31E87F|nr:sulfotransferase [Psychromonas sp. psych-6C06]PKF61719.1 hypothetical protein CW745_10390 [Psychromonas sp. psych-6C06]